VTAPLKEGAVAKPSITLMPSKVKLLPLLGEVTSPARWEGYSFLIIN
jgi:hypothetical protein